MSSSAATASSSALSSSASSFAGRSPVTVASNVASSPSPTSRPSSPSTTSSTSSTASSIASSAASSSSSESSRAEAMAAAPAATPVAAAAVAPTVTPEASVDMVGTNAATDSEAVEARSVVSVVGMKAGLKVTRSSPIASARMLANSRADGGRASGVSELDHMMRRRTERGTSSMALPREASRILPNE